MNVIAGILHQTPTIGTPSTDVALITAIAAITVGVVSYMGNKQGSKAAEQIETLKEQLEKLQDYVEQIDMLLSTTPDKVTIGSIRARLPHRPVL